MVQAKQYRASPSRAKHGFIVGGCAVALGLWIAFFAGQTVVAGEPMSNQRETGMFLVLLGAAVAGYVWWKQRDPAPVLRIDGAGVWCRDWGVTVPWNRIGIINPTGNRLARLIVLRVENADGFLASLPAEVRARLQRSRFWKEPFLRLPDGYADASLEELVATLRAAHAECTRPQ